MNVTNGDADLGRHLLSVYTFEWEVEDGYVEVSPGFREHVISQVVCVTKEHALHKTDDGSYAIYTRTNPNVLADAPDDFVPEHSGVAQPVQFYSDSIGEIANEFVEHVASLDALYIYLQLANPNLTEIVDPETYQKYVEWAVEETQHGYGKSVGANTSTELVQGILEEMRSQFEMIQLLEKCIQGLGTDAELTKIRNELTSELEYRISFADQKL